jgi:hypothetical protein
MALGPNLKAMSSNVHPEVKDAFNSLRAFMETVNKAGGFASTSDQKASVGATNKTIVISGGGGTGITDITQISGGIPPV